MEVLKKKSEKKPKVFFDMDGVLNVWELGEHISTVAAPGYMRNRRPIESMIRASKILADNGYEVWIASAVLPYEYSVPDKQYWIRKYCPWFEESHQIFMPYGTDKSRSLDGLVTPGDVFLDDYTSNLRDLHGAFGGSLECIKVLNGINDTNHSWTGHRVSVYSDAESIAAAVVGFSIVGYLKEGKAND